MPDVRDYAALLVKALKRARRIRRVLLEGYWEIGGVVDKLHYGGYGSQVVHRLSADMAARGVKLGVATLYTCGTLHRGIARTELKELLKKECSLRTALWLVRARTRAGAAEAGALFVDALARCDAASAPTDGASQLTAGRPLRRKRVWACYLPKEERMASDQVWFGRKAAESSATAGAVVVPLMVPLVERRQHR